MSSGSRSPPSAEVVPFQVDVWEAGELFNEWAETNTPVLKAPPGMVTPYFVPFWVFQDRTHDESAYHVDPALQIYGGHEFRRPMTEVLKSPMTRVRPFNDPALLDVGIPVELDQWSLFESTAWGLVGRGLHRGDYRVRRVMMPAYVVHYDAYGETFRAFINGATGAVFGIQETVFPSNLIRAVRQNVVRLLPLTPFYMRLVLSPPVFFASVLGLGAVYLARLYHQNEVLRRRQESYEEWHYIREAERHRQSTADDSWYYRNMDTSRRAAKESSRRGWEHFASQSQKEHSAKESHASHASGLRDPPMVDEGDYYAVLGGLRQSASLKEIKSAFRRELMKYHPDVAARNKLNSDSAAARTRAIYDAYAVLRDPKKRAQYDKMYSKVYWRN